MDVEPYIIRHAVRRPCVSLTRQQQRTETVLSQMASGAVSGNGSMAGVVGTVATTLAPMAGTGLDQCDADPDRPILQLFPELHEPLSEGHRKTESAVGVT